MKARNMFSSTIPFAKGVVRQEENAKVQQSGRRVQ